jgi:hypothetical protein
LQGDGGNIKQIYGKRVHKKNTTNVPCKQRETRAELNDVEITKKKI